MVDFPVVDLTEDDDETGPVEETLQYHLIVSMKTYDVLMAILKELNAVAARQILEIHANGGVVGPSPNFSGAFITDYLNSSEEVDNESEDQKL